MSSEHDHVVQVPRFFILLRIAQIILTFIVFVLACYGISFNNWYFDGLGYALFVTLATFFILGYYLITTLRFPVAYNRWAVLVSECLANVWRLACWAALVAWATAYANWYGFGNFSSHARSYRQAMDAAASIGALNWLLFTITLVVYGVCLHKQRTSGAPDPSGQLWTTMKGPRNNRVGGQAAEGQRYTISGQQEAFQDVTLH